MRQITWETFVTYNQDARGVRFKFEDLCRQLFTYEFLSQNKEYKYIHSNPNNPGIESEPILDEVNNRYIGYQAKYFDNAVDYDQIKESAQKAIKHYKGKLNCIYLFCNKALTTSCASYKKIEGMLKDAGISLQPITDTTILDLIRKYPLLGKYYFDDHEISFEWFKNKVDATIDILGERFNEDFNIDTEASKNLSVFLQNQRALKYFNDKKRNIVEEIESLRWRLDDLYQYASNLSDFINTLPDVNFNCIHDVENWHTCIHSTFKTDIVQIEEKILETQKSYDKIKDTNKDKVADLRNHLRKLDILKNLYYKLELSTIEKELLDKKILIVEGKAGIGKTQLFANEAVLMLEEKQNVLLIIGSDCLSDINIFEQLQKNLRLDFGFEELIDILEVIGEQTRKIIPILIDALNESWKPQLWKSVLPLLYKKISDKNFVRLVVSFRGEYQDSILPNQFLELEYVLKIEHQGFKSNSLETAKEFLNHYGIPFTPLHMFTTNIDNPLFLTLYCKTYQGDEAELPTLYERLLEKANEKIHMQLAQVITNAGYDQSDNIVFPIVEAISKQTLITGKRHFEKSEIESLKIWKTMGLTARPFIGKLIRENILHTYESNGKDYVYFSFDQMNDYFIAKTILSMFQTEEEIEKYIYDNILSIVEGKVENWGNEDLFVHICALYANKFKKECINIIRSIEDETDKENLFSLYIKSFEWRSEIFLSISDLLKLCSEYNIESSIIWNAFINNSVKKNHLMNADSLDFTLQKYPLAERDYLWTIFINGIALEDSRIVQLIELYAKGKELETTDKEQIRLLLILFSWVLTSSNRWLRDTTSKAMIEILKEHFEYNEYLLNHFSNVNDPYVIQRLYGIVFGAYVKCPYENKKEFKSLVCFVFDNIFDKEIVYPDILLRDYAKLIIELYLKEYPDELQNYDFKKINPQYKSIPIPNIDDQQYLNQEFENGLYRILHSMRFEGMGMYGDFGRYTFQKAIQYFEVDNYKIFNYSIYFIINELGYQSELFDDYDGFVTKFDYASYFKIKTERIGKKYQWIAMYNILSRISDYYPMKINDFSEEEHSTYEGPWNPYVKDFDPTLNEQNLFNADAPYFQQVNKHIKEAIQENIKIQIDSTFDEEKWVKSNSTFLKNQMEDLVLTDDKGDKWIVLSKYADTDKNNLEHDKLLEWNWLYGYFVSDEQLATLKEYTDKKMNILYDDITSIPHTYAMYNREYPWSNGSKSILKYQWKDLELMSDESQLITHEVKEPDFSLFDEILKKYSNKANNEEMDSQLKIDHDRELDIPVVTKKYTRKEPVIKKLGKVLSATQELLWEEEFDASKKGAISSFHPCAEIINVLSIKQYKYDGYYCNEVGELISFDTALTNQKAGFIIRKDALDKFLMIKKLHLIWFVNASKEIHDKTLRISKYKDWTGVLEYNMDGSVDGEYYVLENQQDSD